MGGDQHIAVEDGRERRHVRVVGTRGAGPSAKGSLVKWARSHEDYIKRTQSPDGSPAGLPEERGRIVKSSRALQYKRN